MEEMVARASWSYHWQSIIRKQGAHGDTLTGSQVAWTVDLTVNVCVCVCVCVCVVERGTKMMATLISPVMSLRRFCAQVTCSSKEHLLYV